MDFKTHKIFPLLICGIVIAFSPALRAQAPAPSISQAPEVGQGTSTSNVSLGTPGTPFTPSSQGAGKGKGHGRDMGKLAAELGLTPQQKASLRPIMQQRRSEIMAIRKGALPEPQKKAQIQAIRKASNQQIKGILTPEQMQKLAQIMKEHRQQQSQKQG